METRIGVLGGTFNPPHLGHMILAQDALEQFNLSRVILVPCALPPHKPKSATLASAAHRLAMLDAAVEGDVRMEISQVELERPGPSYSVDTIRRLRQLHAGATLVFIVGSDTLAELHAWKDVYDLLNLCEFGVIRRPGYELGADAADRISLRPPWPERLLKNTVSGHAVNISSSDIRHRIAEGMRIRYLVPAGVEMYIAEHSLYRQ